MLALISPLITRGVIDNTQHDRIALELWLGGEKEPLRLQMRGNCWQDIAGCRVEFETGHAKPLPEGEKEPDVVELIRSHMAQGGKFLAGDVTLSRREHHGRVLNNVLSVEFFIGARVRVLLQCVRFRFTVTRGNWRLSAAEDAAQRLFSREALHEHVLYSVRHFRGAGLALMGEELPPCPWDVRLNRAEAYMSIIPTLVEKYRGQPGGHISEAYLVDRTDLLTAAAEEEDAFGHGSAQPAPHAWEMLDFIEPEYVDQVTQAMRHPLFHDTSRLTEAVREHIIEPAGKELGREVVQGFVTLYTGVVTHILSTLLLAQDEEVPASLAARRVEGLRHLLGKLEEGIALVPDGHRAPLEKALHTLSASLSRFCSSLRRG